jgi:SpoVK/Ycf46/Vps4 family AAA+-type ATPase
MAEAHDWLEEDELDLDKFFKGLELEDDPDCDTTLKSRTDANVLLWCLRAIDYCKKNNALYRLEQRKGHRQDNLESLVTACAPLNLPDAVKDATDLARILPALFEELAKIDLPPEAIELSIDAISANCSMTETEKRLILFRITLQENELLENVLDRCFPKLTTGQLFRTLAFLLEARVENIKNALDQHSFLYRAGMLKLDPRVPRSIDGMLDIGNNVMDTFEIAAGDWNAIVRKTCRPAIPSGLEKTDFEHLENEWNLVQRYLEGFGAGNEHGANVLFFGPPGCGKTEFARALVAHSNLHGYELASEQYDGNSLEAAHRRAYYQQAMEYLRSTDPRVLIVDEMDGMLTLDDSPFPARRNGLSKASANSLLENNPVPTIWITNNPGQLDSAQLRRFGLIVRFPRPPRKMIRELLQKRLGGHGLSKQWFESVSASEGVTPGIVDSLVGVATAVSTTGSDASAIENLLDTALKQRGIRKVKISGNRYRIEYCNASIEPQLLRSMLQDKVNARCMLHGSTGTGKTAFAKYIAEELSLTPRVVRPSDLLDPYLGGTEQNIARLFSTSDPDETLIILDEFESFTGNRQSARRNWEVSQVNEMLGQLESYEGRVVACTNLPDYIDAAIRRRFQVKVELLPLNETQRADLFREACKRLGLVDGRGFRAEKWVRSLDALAYGHVANAEEIAVHDPDLTVNRFAQLLREEIETTNGPSKRQIGFAA